MYLMLEYDSVFSVALCLVHSQIQGYSIPDEVCVIHFPFLQEFLLTRAHMTYEAELDTRGRMWEESEAGESGEPRRQSGSSRGLSSEVKMREKAGEVKSERDIEIPLFQAKQGIHLKKSSHSESESVVGAHRPVKKYSEDYFDRTNLILNSEKSRGKAKVRGTRLWASLSICWGSNAQVKSLNFDYSTNLEYFKVGSGNTLPV